MDELGENYGEISALTCNANKTHSQFLVLFLNSFHYCDALDTLLCIFFFGDWHPFLFV